MALRLSSIVEYGEIMNLSRNNTHGFLKLRGMEMPIRLELTGDMGPDVARKHICFEPNPERLDRERDSGNLSEPESLPGSNCPF